MPRSVLALTFFGIDLQRRPRTSAPPRRSARRRNTGCRAARASRHPSGSARRSPSAATRATRRTAAGSAGPSRQRPVAGADGRAAAGGCRRLLAADDPPDEHAEKHAGYAEQNRVSYACEGWIYGNLQIIARPLKPVHQHARQVGIARRASRFRARHGSARAASRVPVPAFCRSLRRPHRVGIVVARDQQRRLATVSSHRRLDPQPAIVERRRQQRQARRSTDPPRPPAPRGSRRCDAPAMPTRVCCTSLRDAR